MKVAPVGVVAKEDVWTPHTHQGKTYYHNAATDEKTWSAPTSGWVRHTDPQSRRQYLLNAASGETKWA